MDQEPNLPSIDETKPAERRTTLKDDDDDLGQSPMWQGKDEGWELTWPIWHMLPRDERKTLADRHGYNTIGEFEEYMYLQRAVDQTEALLQPYENESDYTKADPQPLSSPKKKTPSRRKSSVGEEDDEDSSGDEEPEIISRVTSSACTEDLSLEELMAVAGKMLMLHDELLHQVFSWLPVDAYGTLARVSPHWKHLTRTESVYRRLCERLYLNQSKRRQLHVSHFGNSYRIMLEQRPRVRAAGGCYVLKYSSVKTIQRDMWTEIPVGAILETVYYRYLYFQEDGRVLYALSSTPPHVMFKRFLKVCLKKTEDPTAVWGTFQIQKNACTVTARQSWHQVRFELTIQANSTYGRFGTLELDRHLSSPSGTFDEWSRDLVQYKVPTEQFHFVKDARL